MLKLQGLKHVRGSFVLDYKRPLLFVKGELPSSCIVFKEDGHEIVAVPVTGEMRKLARKLAYQFHRRKRLRGSRERLPRIAREHNPLETEMTGKLGEIALHFLFLETFEDLKHPEIDLGWSDDGDFQIGDFKIDVKTASKSFHKYIAVPLEQFEKLMNFYVGAKIVENHVYFYGYVSREEFEKKAELKDLGYGPSLVLPLKELHSILELPELCSIHTQVGSNRLKWAHPTLPFAQLYAWANNLNGESSLSREPYLLPEEVKRLFNKLVNSRNILAALVGPRGIGKSRALLELSELLSKDNVLAPSGARPGLKTCYLKLQGDVFETLKHYANFEDFLVETILEELDHNPVFRKKITRLAGSEDDFEDLYGLAQVRDREEREEIINKHISKLENIAPKSLFKKVEENIIDYLLENVDVFLIDMPDYPKRDPRRVANDLEEIQKLWSKALEKREKVSIVISMQAETFNPADHFLFGKMFIYRLQSFQPETLANFVKQSFENPFTEDALLRLAELSRGVFRRFKRFIGECLDAYPLARTISLDMVNQAITPGLLASEMEIELAQIFKQEEHKRLAARIILELSKSPGLTQRELARALGVSESKISRMISRLREAGVIGEGASKPGVGALPRSVRVAPGGLLPGLPEGNA